MLVHPKISTELVTKLGVDFHRHQKNKGLRYILLT